MNRNPNISRERIIEPERDMMKLSRRQYKKIKS